MEARQEVTRAARRPRARWAGLAAVGLLVVVGARARATAETGPGSAAARLAAGELERLEERDGTSRSRASLLTRLLSRFFVTYPVPEEADELRRVLAASQRIAERAALLFYRAAEAAAAETGAAAVGTEHLRRTFARLLPSEVNRYDEVVFFAETAPTPLETWDLAAFLDTGFAWEVVLRLAESELAAAERLPLEEEAARTLAHGLNAYGLLLLRLGGEHARAELAPHLRTSHLRDAFKTIAARAGGESAPIGDPPKPAPGGRFFRDVTEAAGVDFRHVTSEWLARFRRYGPIAPTFSGGGVAAGDVDGDGWTDLVLCGGRGCALFRNQGGDRFEEATARAGIAVVGEARMPVLADLDNDGDADLLVTYVHDTNRLFLNRGDGRFEDVTAGSGLESEGRMGGPAVAADFDGDGRLDLYVGNFGNYRQGELPWTSPDARNGQPNRLYRNLGAIDGRLRFEDVTDRAGVGDPGWAQAVSHLDLDLDDDQDLYVANDFGRNELFLNRGDGTFESAGAPTGSDDPHHGMNVAFADLNRDALGDIFVSNIWAWSPAREAINESNSLLLSERRDDGTLVYRRSADPALDRHDTGWAWAALFLDVENDGDDDLFVANGFTDYLIFPQFRRHPELPDQLYVVSNRRESNLLFLADADSPEGVPGRLASDSGAELAGLNSRAVAALDYDRDGDLDLAVTTFHERARLLANVAEPRGGWLVVDLAGDPDERVAADAVGAVVTARAAAGGGSELYVWRAVTGGEGYLGTSDSAVSIGLGASEAADLEIRWPGGRRQRIRGVPAGRFVRVPGPPPAARPASRAGRRARPAAAGGR